MRNRVIVLMLSTILLATMACSLNVLPLRTSVRVERMEAGETRTEDVLIPVPDTAGETELEIVMGAGELQVRPGAGNMLLEGTVVYNVEELFPNVITKGNRIRLQQGEDPGSQVTIPDITGDVENKWDLRLGSAPIALSLTVGASKSEIELGGLALTELSITQGASEFELEFSELNSEQMSSLEFVGGASNAELKGLANANVEEVLFTGGAGKYTLEFDGELQQDLRVEIEAGLGAVVIIVPDGVPAELEYEGALADIDAFDNWERSGDRYTLEGSGPRIVLDVSLGMGELELRNW